jgi:Flp pilus assembly protein TadG
MRARRRPWLSDRKGQAAVELALILPVLVLLLLGMLQVGIVLQDYLQLQQAVEQGARAASLGAADATIQQTVDSAAPSLSPSALTVTVSPAAAERQSGTEITVQGSYGISISIPLLTPLIGGQLEISSQSVMRME